MLSRGRSGGALIGPQHRNLISNKNHNCNARLCTCWNLLGGFDARAPCYAGGIDLDLALDKLWQQTDESARSGPSLPQRVPLPAALSRRPIGDAAMVSAIRQAADGIAAAEDEVAAAGIADWPVAGLLGQLH